MYSDDKRIYTPLKKIDYRWSEAAKWVIKFNFHPNIKTNNKLKKHGEFLNKLFLLIERIVTFDKEGIAIESWREFHIALMQLEYYDCFKGVPYINGSWTKGYLHLLRNRLKILKNNQNPFKTEEFEDAYISHYLNRAFHYKSHSNPFYNKYWKPFLDSYSAYITDLDKNKYIKRTFVEDNKYVFQVNKGNSPKNRRIFPLEYAFEKF